MDKRIVAQFFNVIPKNAAVPEFEVALNSCLALGATPGDREMALSEDDTRVRLERLAQNGAWIEGEVVRVQRDNIPLEAEPDGLHPSRAQSQGHSAVFRYHAGLRILIAERNTSNMTVSRLLRYVRSIDPSARYTLAPTPNEDLWARYGTLKPKRFSVTLASIQNPTAFEGEVGAVLHAGRILHEVTSAPTVRISVSAGDDGLNKGAIASIIGDLLGDHDTSFEVTSLSVSGDDEEEDVTEFLNFLDDMLKVTREIDLNAISPDESFARRIVFLRKCFDQNMAYIASFYGTG